MHECRVTLLGLQKKYGEPSVITQSPEVAATLMSLKLGWLKESMEIKNCQDKKLNY